MDFRYPYYVILGLGVIIGFLKFKKLSKSNKYVLYLLLFTLLFELLSFYFSKTFGANIILYNLFILIQFGFITMVYYTEICKKWIIYSNIILIATFLFYSSVINIFISFNTLALMVSFLITILFGLYFLLQLLLSYTDNDFYDFPIFWVSIGFLIFSILNLFQFGTLNYFKNLPKNHILTLVFDFIRIYSNYFLYTFFIVSFLVKQNMFTAINGSKK